LWVSAGDGVRCYSQDGTLPGKVLIPEATANLFCGPRRNRLLITATSSLYAVYLTTRGAPLV
jgi:gluconolactonase